MEQKELKRLFDAQSKKIDAKLDEVGKAVKGNNTAINKITKSVNELQGLKTTTAWTLRSFFLVLGIIIGFAASSFVTVSVKQFEVGAIVQPAKEIIQEVPKKLKPYITPK